MSSNYLLGLYEKSMPNSFSLCEKLEYTKTAGFDFLEISIDETDEKLSRLNWGLVQRKDTVNMVLDIGVPLGSMCLSGHRKYPIGSLQESTRIEGLDIMARAIDLACDLGVRIIQLAGYDVYYEQSNEKTRAFFMENLKKCGVILAFETMETSFMDTVEKAMYYVKEINSPYLQVYPDLGNLTNAAVLYNHNVDDDLKKGSGHIAALHLKETFPGKYRDMVAGSGHVDFEEGVNTAWRIGVRRFVCELWDIGDNQTHIEHTNAFMRKLLEKTSKEEV